MPAPVTVEVLNGVLKYFKRKNGCTTAELAEGMGVSRATAYQYVRALRDNGVEFDVTPEPTGTRGPPRKRMKVPVDLELVEAPAEPEAEAQEGKALVERVTARYRRDRPEGCDCAKKGRECILA